MASSRTGVRKRYRACALKGDHLEPSRKRTARPARSVAWFERPTVGPKAKASARPVRERVGPARARDVVRALAPAVYSRQPVHHPPRVMPAGMRHAELPRVIPHRPCAARSPAFGHPPTTSKPYRRRAVHQLRCVSNLGIFRGATLLFACRASRIVTSLWGSMAINGHLALAGRPRRSARYTRYCSHRG